ncbi:MAG TPA: hypothetical protein VN282_26780 [Pyrinomonadaceae bacterium]|nr:hypothetical protein [Pyrinomonadaceae bacterium]
MLTRTLLSFTLLLTLAPLGRAQMPAPGQAAPEQTAAADALAARRASLLADLRALEAESKELLKPLDAASARAEIGAAAWTLDREWAKSLLREALALTFPEEVDRARQRERPIGAELQFGPAENGARGRIRRRIYAAAARDRAFARELGETEARELGRVEEAQRETALAIEAAGEGRLEEASELILRAAEAEPTLINVGQAINHVAARDRAAADRLILAYIERLRRLPLSAFSGHTHTGLRLPLGFSIMLRPDDLQFFARTPTVPPPPGREVVRAYVAFIAETMTRIEQERGDLTRMHGFITMVWASMMQHAPEMAAQFGALERASRRPGQAAPQLRTFAEIKTAYDPDRKYDERVKTARQTKDPLQLEVAAGFAMTRKDFEEARKLIALMKDGETKTQLSDEANAKESSHLLDAGDLAGAERLARQLNRVATVIRVFPPLVRRLAKDGDAGRAALLADEAGRLLRAAAERSNSNDNFVPSELRPMAGAIRIYKQTRALEGMSEVALAVEPVAPQPALDLLDALAETAAKARVVSELGNPNFNPEAFARLAAHDPSRVRSTAARLEDRLQRIAALASAYRGEAEQLEKAEQKNATP